MQNTIVRTFLCLECAFFLLSCSSLLSAETAPAGTREVQPIEVTGDKVSYSLETQCITAEGKVKIVYRDIVIFCDRAEVDMAKKVAILDKNIKLVHREGILFADKMTYDFEHATAKIFNLDITSGHFFGKAAQAEKLSDTEYVFRNGYVTTCDLDHPHYRLTAKKILFYPDKKVVAKNMVFRVGNVPLLYIPYFAQDMHTKKPFFTVVPGRDKDWGMFALTSFRYALDEKSEGKVNVDFYERKGMGGGISHSYTFDNAGQGWAKLYYVRDRTRAAVEGDSTNGNRYKVQWRHFVQPDPRLKITMDYNKFSDESFMRDFFRKEYERDVHPLTNAYADYLLGGNSSLSLLVQKRVNNFFTETEYLPSLEYRLYPYRLAESNFYLNMDDRLDNLYLRNAGSDLTYRDKTQRLDMHPVLAYRDRIGPIAIKPYAGIRDTLYSKDIDGNSNVSRFLYEAGTEFSTKIAQVWDYDDNASEERLLRIRHILTPILAYSYVTEPTEPSSRFTQFDSIDAVSGSNMLSFTLDNKVQTKQRIHDKEIVRDVLYFSPTVTYNLGMGSEPGHFQEWDQQIEYNPVEHLSFKFYSVYDLQQENFNSIDTTVRTQVQKLDASVEYRLIRTSVPHSSELISDLSYALSPMWSLRFYHQFDFQAGNFSRQQYTIRRDLHCWWLDFGVDLDSTKSLTFWWIFTLKAFPDMRVNFQASASSASQ